MFLNDKEKHFTGHIGCGKPVEPRQLGMEILRKGFHEAEPGLIADVVDEFWWNDNRLTHICHESVGLAGESFSAIVHQLTSTEKKVLLPLLVEEVEVLSRVDVGELAGGFAHVGYQGKYADEDDAETERGPNVHLTNQR